MLRSAETVFTQYFVKEFGPHSEQGITYTGTISYSPREEIIAHLDVQFDDQSECGKSNYLSINQKLISDNGQIRVSEVGIIVKDSISTSQLSYMTFKTQRVGILSVCTASGLEDVIFKVDSSKRIVITNSDETTIKPFDIESIFILASQHFREGLRICGI